MEYEDSLWSQLPFAPSLTEFRFPELSQGCIRLLLMHGGSKHEGMECSLTVALLKGCPAYEALSYVWGPNSQLETIQLDGHEFNVTPNLAGALRQLRGSTDRLLWIDQLCVNQTDLDERSEQVRMMGQIYSHAQKVIIWLGADPDEEAPLAHKLITNLYDNVKDKYEPGGNDGVKNLFGGLAQITDAILQSLNLPPKASPMWLALSHFIELPYFERVWVVQEVHFATAQVMYWGETEISFPELLTVLPWFVQVEARAMLHEHLLDPSTVSRVLDLRSSSRSFEQALSMTAQRRAGDPRDRAFAILGLVDGGAPFPPDYTRSLMEVYRYTTYKFL